MDRVKKLFTSIDTDFNGVWSWEEFKERHLSLHDESPVGVGKSPTQVHLSITGTPGERIVIWVTDDNTTTHVAQVGTAPGQYAQTFAGASHTYTAGGWKGVIHVVKMAGLALDTKYAVSVFRAVRVSVMARACCRLYYRVGDTDSGVFSDEFSFRTEPVAARPMVFAAYGDMGTTIPEGFLVARQLHEDHAKVCVLSRCVC